MTLVLDTGVNDRGVCQHCGADVTPHFRRVFGDGDDLAHRCFACDTRTRVHSGSAAGRDVDHPDPQEHPVRLRGRRTESANVGGELS